MANIIGCIYGSGLPRGNENSRFVIHGFSEAAQLSHVCLPGTAIVTDSRCQRVSGTVLAMIGPAFNSIKSDVSADQLWPLTADASAYAGQLATGLLIIRTASSHDHACCISWLSLFLLLT